MWILGSIRLTYQILRNCMETARLAIVDFSDGMVWPAPNSGCWRVLGRAWQVLGERAGDAKA